MSQIVNEYIENRDLSLESYSLYKKIEALGFNRIVYCIEKFLQICVVYRSIFT